ncbi:MAG TPA: DUF4202 domain-containing protein [Acidimicrobiales bacterium]|nr:DUF4202 domain-containing protein [Acidimicrobiales bacterium]
MSRDIADAERFDRAIAAIDAANADDPNRIVVRGVERPKELAHAELMTEWIAKLRPDADEALLLAARAHHIRRWTTPRSDYPDGRSGYLKWRTGLHKMHADEVGRILTAEGYDDATITRVQDIVRKRNLAADPDVQALEDALCLVFVETQFHDLAARLDDDKMVDVVRKTLAKMSDRGKAFALDMDLPWPDRNLLERAL